MDNLSRGGIWLVSFFFCIFPSPRFYSILSLTPSELEGKRGGGEGKFCLCGIDMLWDWQASEARFSCVGDITIAEWIHLCSIRSLATLLFPFFQHLLVDLVKCDITLGPSIRDNCEAEQLFS